MCTSYYWEGLNGNFTSANPYEFTAPSSSDGIKAVYQRGQPGLTVVSYHQSGHVITWYYTALYDSSGNLLKVGFTSFTYSPLTYGAQRSVRGRPRVGPALSGTSVPLEAHPDDLVRARPRNRKLVLVGVLLLLLNQSNLEAHGVEGKRDSPSFNFTSRVNSFPHFA